MDVNKIAEPVAEELEALNKLIYSSLYSEVDLIRTIADYLINSGGKRLRPILVLLCSRACNYTGDDHLKLAIVIEFIHAATLLHDDVVDFSTLRRGQTSANMKWGNEAAVLVGDFLYSRAFQLMLEVEDHRILSVLANATNKIAEGEVLQLLNKQNPKGCEEQYLKIISAKTAQLFSAATEISAIVAKQSPEMCQVASSIGMNLGIAYQITDDLLDYTAPSENFGKKLGQDLSEGKLTLPLIYLLNHGNTLVKEKVAAALKNPATADFADIKQEITNSDACNYVFTIAERYTNTALHLLHELPANKYRDSIECMCKSLLDREY